TSSLASPSRSTAITSPGCGPTAWSLRVNEPSPLPIMIETESEPRFATTASSCPFLSKSPDAIAIGPTPTAEVTGVANANAFFGAHTVWVQCPLSQSLSMAQLCPAPHAGHDPPQSVSVSVPFLSLSSQVGADSLQTPAR